MKMIRNSIYTLLGMVAPIVVALIATPLFIIHIGPARYGALAIAWLMLGYFGQADFGIGRAVTQRIARMADASPAQAAVTVCSAIVTIGIFGILAGLATLIASYWFFTGPFDVAQDLREEMIQSIWLLAACSPVVAMFGVANGSLMGREQFKLASLATFVSNSALQIVPLLTAIFVSGNLTLLIAASLAGRSLGLLIALAGVWTTFLKGQRLRANRSEASHLLHFGKWIMVTALVGPFMIIADRFVIGAQLGAVAVAAYTVPFQVASRTILIPLAIIQVMFPRLAAMGDAEARRASGEYTLLVGNIFAPLIVGLICMAEPLLSLWLGDNLDPRSVLIARIILAGFWINGVANVPYSYIQARGISRFTAIVHLCELPLYIALLFGLGYAFGLAGVAAAFALRCLIDCMALLTGSRSLTGRAWLRMLPGGALICTAALLHPWLNGWIASMAAAAILCTLSLVIAYVSTPRTLWEPLLAKLRNRASPATGS